MRILVNFLPLMPRGGGLQNARNLWRAIDRFGGDHRWLAAARGSLGLEAGPGGHSDLSLYEPESLGRRLHLENVVLPGLARSWGADVLWTPMGAGPLRSPVPTVMGWHDSSLAYPESVVHGRLPLRERAVEWARGRAARLSARRAERITVQTTVMRDRLARVWGVPPSRFHIVPNGPSSFLDGEEPAPVRPPPPPTVLVVAEAKPAKNLEVVPEVARLLAERGREDVRFVLTVPPRGAPFTAALDRAMERAGAGAQVERIGRVPHEELGPLYRAAWAVFLPSLFESFSATYVEAMHFGVPLVTSDMDFARHLCGDAAVYVDPLDAAACADALTTVLDDPAVRQRLRRAGFGRLPAFPGWRERLGLYLDALRSACDRRAGRGVEEVLA